MKKVSHSFLKMIALGGLLLLVGFSCKPGLKSDLPVVRLQIKDHSFWVEVANKPATRMSGLMFRRDMDPEVGMLFVFPDSAPRAFWMKNTQIPLSVCFMDEKGEIENVLEMPPQTLDAFPSKGPAKFVLEMNRGWFDKNGFKPGDRVEGVLQAPAAVN